MLFLSGHESWSETFFGSANDPPPSPAPSPASLSSCGSYLGGSGNFFKFPRSRLPLSSVQDLLQELAEKKLMKNIL